MRNNSIADNVNKKFGIGRSPTASPNMRLDPHRRAVPTALNVALSFYVEEVRTPLRASAR
jgi:hypothetical protein